MLTKHFLVMPVIAMLALGTAGSGAAQTGERTTRIIPVNRADLLTPSGRARMEQKIARGVRQVCQPNDRRGVLYNPAMIDCRTAAMADARRQLDRHIATATRNVQIAAANSAPVSR